MAIGVESHEAAWRRRADPGPSSTAAPFEPTPRELARPEPAPAAGLRILYIGPAAGTCLARFEALRRLGHRPTLVDPFDALPPGRLGMAWTFQTGAWGLGRLVEAHVLRQTADETFDLAYVDCGELVGAELVRQLRRRARRVVNYNPDNPYQPRDGRRWGRFLRAVPEYDLVVVPRIENVAEARRHGAREVMRVWFAADDPLREDAGLPGEGAKTPFRSAVSFVGSWMPERGPFLARLLALGVPLRILGPRWNRAAEFRQLAPHAEVGALAADAYNAAVAAADISIALLSKGNRDLHTTRSVEIPVLGSLLCCERTEEHRELYVEETEALMWSSPEECAQQCLAVLADRPRLARIAAAGRRRALANNHFNEPLMCAILDRALGGDPR